MANLWKRHVVPEPNCKPVHSKGQPLGMEKFASLFVFYTIGCFASLVILIFEKVYKPSKSQTLQYKMKLKKEAISRSMKHLESYSNDKEVTILLFEMKKLIEIINKN